jgi:tetratricopeptide (TPR) repeat protein
VIHWATQVALDLSAPRADSPGGKANIDAEAVASTLDKIIHSKVFADSVRLKGLLAFVVSRSLSGADGDLKEAVIAIEVFGKPHDFDPRIDATVRVAANRLRTKLRTYYSGEGVGDPIRIELPEGHYLPRFSTRLRSGGSSEESRIAPVVEKPVPILRAGFDARTFVGRQTELERLQVHLGRAFEGHGHMLCIVAEAGIGKTALIEAFLERAGDRHRFVAAVGGCRRELEYTESYLPWLELLEELASGGSAAESLLRETAPTWWNRLRFQSPGARIQQESSVKREMERFLRALTDRQPLVLVLEDLHWADVSTVDLISYLGPGLASLPILLVASYRPSDLILGGSPFLKVEPELKVHRVCEDLPLGALSFSDTQRYFDLRFPEHTFPPELVHHVQSRSEGNALCLMAMVDCAVERGWIASQDRRWELAVPLERWDLELPPSVGSMVGVKLAALTRFDRELLSAAAVQGPEFEAAVLARALNLDCCTVEERLAALHGTHRLLSHTGDLRLPGGVTRRYRFAHVLYQEALLKAVEPSRHRRLCALLARAIIACYGEMSSNIVGNVARLLHEGGDGLPALPYYARAAADAVQLSAYRQALDLASQAASIARACAPSEATRRFEIEFLTTEAVSLTSLDGFAASEIEHIYQRARQVAQELGDLTAATSIAHLHWGLVSVSNLERARKLADILWQDADASQNLEAKALASMAQGIALFHMGALDSGAAVLREATEQWRRLKGALGFRSYMLDPAIATQCNWARALWFTGKPGQAWQTSLDAVDLASRIGHHRTTAYALALAADIAHLRCDPAGTMEWAERAIEVAREHEFLYEATWARVLQGWALAHTGELARSVGIFEGVSQYRGPSATKFLCHFAEALGKLHRYDKAFAVLEDAFRLAEGRGERYYLSELQRIGGEIAARSGGPAGPARAEAMLRKAVHTARESHARSCELRATSSLVRFCREFRPRCSWEALADLRRVVTTLPEAADTLDGAEAWRLLQDTV